MLAILVYVGFEAAARSPRKRGTLAARCRAPSCGRRWQSAFSSSSAPMQRWSDSASTSLRSRPRRGQPVGRAGRHLLERGLGPHLRGDRELAARGAERVRERGEPCCLLARSERCSAECLRSHASDAPHTDDRHRGDRLPGHGVLADCRLEVGSADGARGGSGCDDGAADARLHPRLRSAAAYYWRERREEFSIWLHGAVPAAGIVGLAAVIYYQYRPLPDYPVRWANWYMLGGIVVGVVVGEWLARRKPAALQDAGRVFVEG